MEFHINQEVVCIETHPDKIIKEGDVFTVVGLRTPYCSYCTKFLGNILIDIGIADPRCSSGTLCKRCGYGHAINYVSDGIWWFGARRFRPLDELADISELTEVLATTNPFEVK